MAEREPRVAVLTLSSGEPQLERCRASTQRQQGVIVEHVEFRDYGNREGHDALHRYVERCAGDFDAFFKLDADMVLRTDTAIAAMLEHWRRYGSGSLQAEFPVHDVLGAIPIMGVHIYAPGARWSRATETLFVDPRPDNVVRRDKFPGFAPVVDHMPGATVEQAFVYGFHRALKAFQFGRTVPNLWQMRAQWVLIRSVRRAGRRDPQAVRTAMLAGAARACECPIDGYDGNYRQLAHAAFTDAVAASNDPEFRDDDSADTAWSALLQRRIQRLPLDLVRSLTALMLLAWPGNGRRYRSA